MKMGFSGVFLFALMFIYFHTHTHGAFTSFSIKFCLSEGWASSCVPREVCFINPSYTHTHIIRSQHTVQNLPRYPQFRSFPMFFPLPATKFVAKENSDPNKSTLNLNFTGSQNISPTKKNFQQPELVSTDVSNREGSQTQLLHSSFDVTTTETMPSVHHKMTKTAYMRPQGEAWKEGNFPKESPRIIAIDPFDILIQMRSEPGWFYRDILQEATDYNARLLPPEHYTEAYHMAYKQVQTQYPCFGVRDGITSKDWWRNVSKLTYQYADLTESGLRGELDEWLFEDIFDVLFHDVFMTKEAWEIRPGALEALSFLKKWRDNERNGPTAMCVLCNFDERMHAILNELDLKDPFDFILTSREIGTELPERSAFQVAMSRVGVTNPIHCMHVSADLSNCVVGASKSGWHSVYLPKTGEENIPLKTNSEIPFTMLRDLFAVLHIWKKEPENRLIDTTQPVLENGIFGFHEKDWNRSHKVEKDDPYFLPQTNILKSWDGPERF